MNNYKKPLSRGLRPKTTANWNDDVACSIILLILYEHRCFISLKCGRVADAASPLFKLLSVSAKHAWAKWSIKIIATDPLPWLQTFIVSVEQRSVSVMNRNRWNRQDADIFCSLATIPRSRGGTNKTTLAPFHRSRTAGGSASNIDCLRGLWSYINRYNWITEQRSVNATHIVELGLGI